jgi:chromosome partitioning protein
MIYLIANTKGGVGKSTLATNLAAWLSQKGSTLLIDTDKQQTSASWGSWRHDAGMETNPDVIMLQKDQVYKQGKTLAGRYDHTVVDAGGRDSDEMRFALLMADKVILPISPSSADTASWDDFYNAYSAALINNPSMQICVVMARITSGRSERRLIELRNFFEERNIHVLDTIIPEAVAYVDAYGDGIAVFERNIDDKASFSTKKFCKEVTA